jgi:hypothetical protein
MHTYARHRIALGACRLCSLAIDCFGSYALFVVVNRISRSILLAGLWAVVFFVLACSLKAVGESLPTQRRIAMLIALHILKSAIGLFEAIVIADGLDLAHRASATASFTATLSMVLRTNAGLVALLFVLIYGLDIVTALLPEQLRMFVGGLQLDLKPGQAAWVRFRVGDHTRPWVTLTLEHVIIGGLRDDVMVAIKSASHNATVNDLGSLHGQGRCAFALAAGEYVLHVTNDNRNDLRRRGAVNLYEL